MTSKPGKILLILALLFSSAASCIAQSAMTHHVRDAVRNGQAHAYGRLPNNQVLQLDLVLPLRDPAGLKTFLADVYNPSSRNYHKFLTPAEFTARFGPTTDQYESVQRFATTYGLQVVGGSRDGMEVQVRGTVANIEAAFHVNMRTYNHPTESRMFYGPDHEPTMDLSFNLWHISGLDNFSIPKPMYVKKDEYAAAHGIQAEADVSHATTGSGPSASFLGSDMRKAYYGGTALTGSGQHLGLLEFYGTNLSDLNTYFANVHQSNNVPINLISTDGTSTSCNYPGCDDIEQTLDMTQAIGMAPGLASLDMYIGSSDTAMISAMTTHNPLPSVIGCSWGWTPVDPSALDPYFQKMAAQGQNFFVAAGDSQAWTSGNYPWPAEDGNVVTVGGTDLITSGAGGAWASETAWVDSGGGISPHHIAIPSYQTLAGVINSTNKGSTVYRNGPDVSANANFTFYTCGDQQACQANVYGGTSFAAPMWAGLIALVNQQLAQNSQPPVGFLNPTIYADNLTSSYATNFHDVTSGNAGTYSAVTGYDLVTGWGSPTPALISALTGPPSPSFSLSASSSSVSVVQGGSANPAPTITMSPLNGFNSTVSLSASGQPSTVSVTLNPQSIPGGGGTSTMSIAAGSTTPTGTYTITVQGTGGGVTQTTTVTLTVTAAAASYAISALPSSVSINRGGSAATSKISASVASGSPTISLSASGVPRGVSVSFSPTSISSSTSSTMSIRANRNSSRGTYKITVIGTGGGTSANTSVTVTVN